MVKRKYIQEFMINGVMIETIIQYDYEVTDIGRTLVKTTVIDVKTGESTI